MGCVTHYNVVNSSGWQCNCGICISQTTNDVLTSITMKGNSTLGWRMNLQRQDLQTQDYFTIATRTGYLTEDSPSNRTFTNVLHEGRFMRLEVTFWDYGSLVQRGTYYSEVFYR